MFLEEPLFRAFVAFIIIAIGCQIAARVYEVNHVVGNMIGYASLMSAAAVVIIPAIINRFRR